MKETLAATLAGFRGLGWDEAHEKTVDRLTALGAMQNRRSNEALNAAHLRSLGQDVIAFKWANRADIREDAIDKLTLQLMTLHRMERRAGLCRKIAAWALQEYVIDLCPPCTGRGKVPQFEDQDDGRKPMIFCATCNGTGKRRYSDGERIEATGGSHGELFARAHGFITRAVYLADEAAARMLERW